jgi:parallel beta-helix repeat protein
MGGLLPFGTRTKNVRSATIVIAASNSADKTRADYVCTGANDDQTINKATSKLSTTGGSIRLLDGTFQIGSPIILYSKILFQGLGSGELNNETTLLNLMQNSNCSVIQSYQPQTTQSYGINIRDLAIEGNASLQNGAGPYHAINMSNQRGTIRDVLIHAAKGRGIYWAGNSGFNCIYGRVEKCSANACYGSGIFFDYYTVNMIADDNIIEGCGLTNSEPGIVSNGPYNIIRNHAQIYNCYQGIGVNGNQSGLGTFIVNNQIELNQREGILITDSPDCKIIGNGFLQNGQSANATYANIRLNGNAAIITGTMIQGNVFRYKDTNNDTSIYTKYGVLCMGTDGTNYNTISNNDFKNGYSGTGSAAISGTGANDVTTPNIT